MTDSAALRSRARSLIATANEMLTIARDLDRMAAEVEAGPGVVMLGTPGGSAPAKDHPYLLDLARRAYADRRRRDKVFQNDLFGEPAWDILLDLFISAKQGKRVSVSSACIGAAVPNTTALRWLAVLEQRGLIVREDDPADARRAFLHLSAEAYARMCDFLADETIAAADRTAMAVNG